MMLPARPTPIMSKRSRVILRRNYRQMRKHGVPRWAAKSLISSIELAVACDEIFLSVEEPSCS